MTPNDEQPERDEEDVRVKRETDPTEQTIGRIEREVALIDQRIQSATELADEKLGRLRDRVDALERQIAMTREADQKALDKALSATEATTEMHEATIRSQERKEKTYVTREILDRELAAIQDKLRRIERGEKNVTSPDAER